PRCGVRADSLLEVYALSDCTVLKFGGTSVADAAACARVAGIVREHGGPRPVVVVSALARMTDALFACARAAADGDVAGASRRLDDQLDRHTELAQALLRPDTAAGFHEELARARRHLTGLFGRLGSRSEEAAALQDEVASFGERLSASLLAAVLAAAGLPTYAVDARRCIVTDTTYGRANPMPADTERRTRAELVPLLDASLVPVLGGYIASTQAGRTTRPGAVKAIAHKTGVTVLQVVSSRMLGAYGFLRALFEVFDRHRTEVDVVTTSEVSVSLTLEHARALPAIVSELKSLGDVSVEPDRAIVCVVGEGLRTTPGVAARIFSTIQDINVSLISQGASRVNLTFVIEEDRVREAVQQLHAAFFEREPVPVAAD